MNLSSSYKFDPFFKPFTSRQGLYLNIKNIELQTEYVIGDKVDGFVFNFNTNKSLYEIVSLLNLFESTLGLNQYGIVHQPKQIAYHDHRDVKFHTAISDKPMYVGDYVLSDKTIIKESFNSYNSLSRLFNVKYTTIESFRFKLHTAITLEQLAFFRDIIEFNKSAMNSMAEIIVENIPTIVSTMANGAGNIFAVPPFTSQTVDIVKNSLYSALSAKIQNMETSQWKL